MFFVDMEGARSVVGGRILKYPAKNIFNQGFAQGEARGITIGRAEGEARARRSIMETLVSRGMSRQEAAALVGVPV